MKNNTLHIRRFLNETQHGRAYVCASINPNRYTIEIADCSNTITLSNDFSIEETKQNALYKLETLIQTLTEVKGIVEKKELKKQIGRVPMFATENSAVEFLAMNKYVKTDWNPSEESAIPVSTVITFISRWTKPGFNDLLLLRNNKLKKMKFIIREIENDEQ
jgi:hypothetical protein